MSTEPKIADDLIKGAKALSRELGWPPRRIYHAFACKQLPFFQIGKTICGRRSTLREHFAKLESRADAAGWLAAQADPSSLSG